MKVSAIKKNKDNPQTFINIGFSGIMDVWNGLIFAVIAKRLLQAVKNTQAAYLNSVLASVMAYHLGAKSLGRDNQWPTSDRSRGIKEWLNGKAKSIRVRASSEAREGSLQMKPVGKSLRLKREGRNLRFAAMVIGIGKAVARQTMKRIANRWNTKNGDGKYSSEIIGRVKNVASVAESYTLTTSSRSHSTQTSASMFPTVGRFASLVISRPTLMDIKL